jgi:alpha-L-fucosidase
MSCHLRHVKYAYIFLLLANFSFSSAQPTPEPERTERTRWWRDAKFGMFIHWGLYAIPAGEWQTGTISQHNYSEWIMYQLKIPVAQYEKLAGSFNPVQFNADDWVRLAKNTGMKYIVITTKHHDGFSMFDSKVTTYDIMDAAPFKRDPLKELAEACRKQGIKLGFYYSVDRDWHHPDARGNYLKQNNDWDYPDESNQDFNQYFERFALPQIEELLTQYGPVAIMWFDDIGIKTPEQNKKIIELVRKYQPQCLINSRLGEWKRYEWGDYREMNDNEVSNKDLGYGWENPGTLNRSYGYNKFDTNWQSPADVIRLFVDIASNGGNYLLNVGPTADGLIPAPSVRILQEVGKWVDKYGESIYGSQTSNLAVPVWGRITTKPDKYYLHIFNWPANDLIQMTGLQQTIKKVYLLADANHTALRWHQTNGGEVTVDLDTIHLPADALDAGDTVVVLEVE